MKNLVFVHGSGSNRAVWAYQSRHFWRYHHVLALDLPGHGLSKDKPRATLDGYVDYIKSTIRTRALASPVIIGHSLGGAIALRIALDAPSELGGLVLVGTGARLQVLPELFAALSQDFERAIGLIGSYAFSPRTPRLLVEKALGEMRKRGPETLINDFAAVNGFDVRNELGRIDAPTLIVTGADDRLTPVEFSEYLSKHIPHSQLRILADAGHMVMLEQPEAFNSTLETFVESL